MFKIRTEILCSLEYAFEICKSTYIHTDIRTGCQTHKHAIRNTLHRHRGRSNETITFVSPAPMFFVYYYFFTKQRPLYLPVFGQRQSMTWGRR